ncbi:hypothetical protein HPB49_005964 [Dermacentor silvarum]|uniref:Uncharacterized protein n=1 Tax=Dermacentor silvarum TaxID=543639 RepID=A0ACB8DMJ8_DERSI|nr:hypothetical protein HPB49_005964 [Dermacentor silvarum]
MKVQAVGHQRYTLGEGPHWDERSGTLLFVDGHGCQILRYDPESRTETEVVRLGSMPVKIDPVDIESIVRGKNNFWSFSKGQLKHKLDKVNLSNGIAWTADNRTMFYNDSVPGTTYAFDFDVASGDISNKRVLLDFKATPGFEELGLPDGMTIDVNDKIWLACCLSGLVLQVDPETAKVLTKVSFPTKYTTSCCFGGRNYDTLYVTSGNFPPDATQPEDGRLYEVTELGAKGKAAFEFAG